MSTDDDGWDITDLGRQGGEAFLAEYDPARSVVRLSGTGGEPEEFPVDRDSWQEQAALEMATRGYGARWTRWDTAVDGGMVMSTARTRTPDDDTSWELGAATYSPAAAEAPEPLPYTPPERGRVRVYPTYTFPVYSSGWVGLGAQEQITVTDWRKQGRQWAEQEARRQVSAALGEPSDDDSGRSWWMGRPKRDEFRWQPDKGTPRSTLPFDGMEQPQWQPDRPEPGTETETASAGRTGTGTGTETGGPRIPAEHGQKPNPRQDPSGWAAASSDAELADFASRRGVLPRVKKAIADEQLGRAEHARISELVDEAFPPDSDQVEAAMRGETETAAGVGTTRSWRVEQAAATGTPFVLDASGVQPGDRVLDTGKEEIGTVREVDGHGGVLVGYDRELTPGQPGTAAVHMLSGALEAGSLQKVPQDATYASLEDRLPPAEQADRYAARKAHYAEHRGPGKRGKKGWTAHKRACRVCADIDGGGDGTGRRLAVVLAPPPADDDPADPYPVKFTYTGGGGEEGEIRHWTFETALDALRDHVAAYRIPDDGTGVLDVDSFIASIGGYVSGLGGVLLTLAERLGGGQTPIAAVVGEALLDFAASLQVMSGEAGQVYQSWLENDDNAHDLRRARGEIPGADLFNVSAA